MKKKHSGHRIRWLIVIFLLIIVAIVIIAFFRSGGGEIIRQAKKDDSQPRPAQESPLKTEFKTVTLFFLSEDDGLLHREEREIQADSSTVREAERLIAELLKGSQKGLVSTIPPETKLRQLFITREGVAYVDFSKEIAEKHPSGSSAEVATVYSIVNSLAHNFRSVKTVFILVEGQERDTLGGHVSLNRPFLPLYSLVVD